MSLEILSSKRLAQLIGALSLLMTVLIVVMVVITYLDNSYQPTSPFFGNISDSAMVLTFTVVGVTIALKRPGNLVGWALILAGAGSLFGNVMNSYAELALLAKPEADLPGSTVAAAINAGSWTPLMCGVFLLVLLFPSGQAPTPRWRPVGKLVPVFMALIWAGITISPGHFDPPFDAYTNPLAFTSSDDYIIVIFGLIAFCLLSIAAAAVHLIIRFRRSRGDEREQYKWLAASAGLLIVTLPVGAAFSYSNLAGALFSVALISLPISVGVAVLRYNLYEIDRIINRTLSYGLLTALLAGTYALLVLVLQELLRPINGGSEPALVTTTLIIAALFLPARRRIQLAVDRRFNRQHYDAERTVEAFAARLRQEIDLDTLRTELLTVLDDTMQPATASLWLRRTGAGS